MRRILVGLLIVATLAVVIPGCVVLSWRDTYGTYSPTNLVPPNVASLQLSPRPPAGCVGFWRDGFGWRACDTESQWDAEVAVWKYLHWNGWSTPHNTFSGSVNGIVLPAGTTLVEHCGAPGEACEYTELIGHRGQGWVLIRDSSNRERLALIQNMVDEWNGAS